MKNEKKSLDERLQSHPILRKRVESLLDVVENASGDVEKANEAEKQVIENLQQMGKEALQTWGSKREHLTGNNAEKKFGASHEKKKSIGKRPMEK